MAVINGVWKIFNPSSLSSPPPPSACTISSVFGKKIDDFNQTFIPVVINNYVMFFTNKGRVYILQGNQISKVEHKVKWNVVMNLLRLRPNEKIISVIAVSEFSDSKYLFMVTSKGIVKRCKLSDFSFIGKNGSIALLLNDNEELVKVKVTDGNASILIVTHYGMAICFDEQEVRCMKRIAHGVKGIKLNNCDCVVSMDVNYCNNETILVMTELGISIRAFIYYKQRRGGKGWIIYNVTKKTGMVADMCFICDSDLLYITSANGYVRCINEEETRVRIGAAGKQVMLVYEEDKVVSIRRK